MPSLITEALMWDSLHRLHKINNYLATAASEIEELNVNMLDAGLISEQLQAFSGITLWKLRDICDFMCRLERLEYAKAQKFEDYLNGNATREEMEIPLDYNI